MKFVDEKAAFKFKGEKKEFTGVDVPFSHEANAQSMLMIEEEESREHKITLKGRPQLMKMIEEAETHLQRYELQMQEMAKQSWMTPGVALDPSFVDQRRKALQQQGSLQNKIMLLKNQLMAEEQSTPADPVKSELEDVKFDTWYINMDKSDSRKTCIERQLHEAGIQNPNRFPAVEIRGRTKEGRKLLQKAKVESARKLYVDQEMDTPRH